MGYKELVEGLSNYQTSCKAVTETHLIFISFSNLEKSFMDFPVLKKYFFEQFMAQLDSINHRIEQSDFWNKNMFIQ